MSQSNILNNILKKSFLSEEKFSHLHEELEEFKKTTTLSNDEVDNIIREKTTDNSFDKEIDNIVNELIELEQNLRIIHPNSASIFMLDIIYLNTKHLFSKKIKEAYLIKKNEIDKKKIESIKICIDNLSTLCNYDFKSKLLESGYPIKYI
jgi:hypothetical protein